MGKLLDQEIEQTLGILREVIRFDLLENALRADNMLTLMIQGKQDACPTVMWKFSVN